MFRRKATKKKEKSIEAKQESQDVVPQKEKKGVEEEKKAPPGPLILVDGSNVAYGNAMASSKPSIRYLRILMEELKRSELKVRYIVDATLRHKVDDKDSLERLLREESIMQVPARTSADDYIWLMAKLFKQEGNRVFILTNDLFPNTNSDREKVSGIERMTFMFIDDKVVMQPSLESIKRLALVMQPREHEQAPQPVAEKKPALRESVQRKQKAPLSERHEPSGQESNAAIPDSLVECIRDFVKVRDKSLDSKINFAVISGHLHTSFGGNFCTKFGYKKPKQLALLLESNGYAQLSHKGPTLYIEPTQKLISWEPGNGSK